MAIQGLTQGLVPANRVAALSHGLLESLSVDRGAIWAICEAIKDRVASSAGADLRRLVNGWWLDKKEHNTPPFVRFHVISARPEWFFANPGAPRGDEEALVQFSVFAPSEDGAGAAFAALTALFDSATLESVAGPVAMVREIDGFSWDEGCWHYSADYRASL